MSFSTDDPTNIKKGAATSRAFNKQTSLSKRKSVDQGNNSSYHEGRVPQAEI
jgi:hypothetical protein